MLADLLTPVTIAQVLAVGLIGVYTYRKDMLNAAGAFTSFVMGALIVVFTNVFWLLLLFGLLGLGSLATRFQFEAKQAAKLEESEDNSGTGRGRRTTRNVIANGLVPAVLAVFAPAIASTWNPTVAAIAYISAIAVAASDTFASEFGSLAPRVRLITTLREVPAGVDGGVSLRGQVAALVGAALMAGLGLLLLGPLRAFAGSGPAGLELSLLALVLPTAIGFAGCQVDSILGATLEGGGLFTKEETNLTAIATGGAAGLVLAIILLG